MSTDPPRTGGASTGGRPVAGADVADRVAAAVRVLPTVAELHPGEHGEIATFLPGRRVTGVRVRDTEITVAVTAAGRTDLRLVADQVRLAAETASGAPRVDVVIADIEY